MIENDGNRIFHCKIGDYRRCYYDRSNDVTFVQWTPPSVQSVSPRPQKIFVTLGLVLLIIAAVLILLTAAYMIFYGRFRLRHVQRRNQMLQHFSEEHY